MLKSEHGLYLSKWVYTYNGLKKGGNTGVWRQRKSLLSDNINIISCKAASVFPVYYAGNTAGDKDDCDDIIQINMPLLKWIWSRDFTGINLQLGVNFYHNYPLNPPKGRR